MVICMFISFLTIPPFAFCVDVYLLKIIKHIFGNFSIEPTIMWKVWALSACHTFFMSLNVYGGRDRKIYQDFSL